MRWKVAIPDRTHLADAVRNCDGRLTYIVKRTQRTLEGGYTYDVPELWTVCDGDPHPNRADWNADNLVTALLDPTIIMPDGQPAWGNARFPIYSTPVCPPDTFTDRTRALFQRLVEEDGVDRFNIARALIAAIADHDVHPFTRALMELKFAFAERGMLPRMVRIPQLQTVNLCYVEDERACHINPFCLWDPIRARCAPNPDAYDELRYPRRVSTIDWVLPGYWVMIGEDAYEYLYQPDMQIPYHDPVTGERTVVWADADERRDMCFD